MSRSVKSQSQLLARKKGKPSRRRRRNGPNLRRSRRGAEIVDAGGGAVSCWSQAAAAASCWTAGDGCWELLYGRRRPRRELKGRRHQARHVHHRPGRTFMSTEEAKARALAFRTESCPSATKTSISFWSWIAQPWLHLEITYTLEFQKSTRRICDIYKKIKYLKTKQ